MAIRINFEAPSIVPLKNKNPYKVLSGVNEVSKETVTCFVHDTTPYIWLKWDKHGLSCDEIKQTVKNDWVGLSRFFL